MVSRHIVEGLDTWRRAVERLSEDTFHAIYGAPTLQAALGIDTSSTERPRKAERSKLHEALVERRIEELRAGMSCGGLAQGLVRALLWVGWPAMPWTSAASLRSRGSVMPTPPAGR
jgi:hypothetical protein